MREYFRNKLINFLGPQIPREELYLNQLINTLREELQREREERQFLTNLVYKRFGLIYEAPVPMATQPVPIHPSANWNNTKGKLEARDRKLAEEARREVDAKEAEWRKTQLEQDKDRDEDKINARDVS